MCKEVYSGPDNIVSKLVRLREENGKMNLSFAIALLSAHLDKDQNFETDDFIENDTYIEDLKKNRNMNPLHR